MVGRERASDKLAIFSSVQVGCGAYQPNTRVPPYNVRAQLPTAAPLWHLGSRLHTSPLVLPIATIAGSGRLAIEMEAAGAAPEVRERCCRATEDFVQFRGEGAAYPLSLPSTSTWSHTAPPASHVQDMYSRKQGCGNHRSWERLHSV